MPTVIRKYSLTLFRTVSIVSVFIADVQFNDYATKV